MKTNIRALCDCEFRDLLTKIYGNIKVTNQICHSELLS